MSAHRDRDQALQDWMFRKRTGREIVVWWAPYYGAFVRYEGRKLTVVLR